MPPGTKSRAREAKIASANMAKIMAKLVTPQKETCPSSSAWSEVKRFSGSGLFSALICRRALRAVRRKCSGVAVLGLFCVVRMMAFLVVVAISVETNAILRGLFFCGCGCCNLGYDGSSPFDVSRLLPSGFDVTSYVSAVVAMPVKKAIR